MQLKTQTDYAIRILLCLSRATAPVVARELSSTLGIAENYLPKITQRLRRAGWVESTSGVNGGFRLLVRPDDISLLGVMREMEGSVCINRCLEADTDDSQNRAVWGPMHLIYMDYQRAFEWYFKSITIRELSEENAARKMRNKRMDELRRFCDTSLQHSGLKHSPGMQSYAYADRETVG